MKRSHIILLGIVLIVLTVSGIGPADRLTWVMEVLPVVIAIPVLAFTYRSFPLTELTYVLISVHSVILCLGAHYTYAEVPWASGFLICLILSEITMIGLDIWRRGSFRQLSLGRFLRKTPLQPGGWLSVLCVSFCLAFSAFYEMLEWWAAVILDQGAEAFLGTQGDPWDTQWDMFLAMCGAIIAVAVLSKIHDRQLRQVHAP